MFEETLELSGQLQSHLKKLCWIYTEEKSEPSSSSLGKGFACSVIRKERGPSVKKKKPYAVFIFYIHGPCPNK